MIFILMFVSSIGISGCQTSVPANDFCLIAKPIPNSAGNAPATRRAVDEFNLIGVRLCGW